MDFKSRYRRECLLKGTSPLHVIEACLADAILNFKFFRIPLTEWNPILSALKSSFTIKKICVANDVDLSVNDKIHKQKLKHLNSLMESLSVHFSHNHILTKLELVGLPFSYADIQQLSKGIVDSDSLQHISLAGSKICDEGLIHISEAIKMKPNIVCLDLRNCGLTCSAGKPLASLVHFQAVARENAAWKASLRGETPNLDLMGGLRRLSLSCNQHLCDAVRHLAVVLYEDRWIKAIDLQYCNLENTHLEQLIRAAEQNQSLIFLDINNNNNLNSKLLNKLKEVLKSNSLKQPSFIFESINLPKHLSNFVLANQVKQNYLVKDLTSSKEINPIAKAETPESKSNSRNHTKYSDASIENKPLEQLTDPMIDLLNERKLRSVADQQVIKMRSEMESARTRITKLEEDVIHLGAKQKMLPMKPMLSDHPKVVKNDISNDSLTQSFLTCLERLQDVLKELKLTSAVSHRRSDTKDPSQEIQGILDSVYAAVREFAPKMNHLILESCRPLTKAEETASNEAISRKGKGKKAVEQCSDKQENSSFSFNQKVKERYVYSENLFDVLDKNHRCESVSTTTSGKMQTSVMVKGGLTRDINLVKSASPKPPQFDAQQKGQNDVSLASSQDASRNVTNNYCINSLKSLQSNLEEILQELSEKIDNASSDETNSRSQLLTINGNLSDLTNQEAEPHYSMDFDSFCTSKNSVSTISNDEKCRPSSSRSKKRRNFSSQEPKAFSSSSSSINLSSIVDLLGNFSVEDIGSSTLTPP